MWEEKPDDHIVQSSPPASIYIDYFLVERMVETACTKKKPSEINHLASILAERVGFEPTVVLPLRLISSQVHSTTLPPLRVSVLGTA